MQRFVYCTLSILMAIACSNIPNKSIIEPLTDQELHRALKDEYFSKMYYYCFNPARNRPKVSELPQLRRVELMDVTYRSFTKYYKELYDMIGNIDTLSVTCMWERRYGTEERLMNQLDSVKQEWEDFIRFSQVYNNKSLLLPNSIWYELLRRRLVSEESTTSGLSFFNEKYMDYWGHCVEFNVARDCINPEIETFTNYFCITYLFEDSSIPQKYPKEVELFKFLFNVEGGFNTWPWAYMFYELDSSDFPTTWHKIKDSFIIEPYIRE